MTAFPKKVWHFASHYPWLVVAMMTIVNLAAFWVLLGDGYSPDNYQATRAYYGFVELAWMQVSCVATILFLAWLRSKTDECRRLARAGLVVTVSSVIVLAKRLLGGHIQCLDPILFSTACGWTIALWLGKSCIPDSVRNWFMRWGPSRYHLEPITLLSALVVSAGVGLFFYYMAQQIYYLNNLALGYVDCGDPARIMYNTLHNPRELFLRVNPDKLLFYDHFQPGILPFIPLWLLWPDIKVTILLQVLATVGCVIPIYWIGKEVLRDKVAALLLAAIWLVFPSTSLFVCCGSYGFRWGDLCLPLYFLALACWIKGRSGTALLFAVWAILIKEEAAILIGMFGLYLVFFEKRRWMGTVILIAAFAYFLLVTSVILPAMNHRVYLAQGIFTELGASKWEILLSPLMKLHIFWGKLLAPSTFYFVALLLAPLLFVPLKKSSVLFIGSLIFLFDCLYPMLKSISYWYQAALLPVVFWALAAALRTDRPVRQRATLSGAVVAGILLSIFFGNTCWSKDTILLPLSPGRLQRVQRMAQHIAPHGSLFATQRVAAHFITQKYLYLDPPLPPDIDYVLLDLRDSWREMFHVNWLAGLRDFQRQVEARSDLHLVDAEDGLLLYSRRGNAFDPRKVVQRDSLPPDAVRQRINLGGGVEIVGYTIATLPSHERADSEIVRVTTFNRVTAPTNIDLGVRCILSSAMETDSYASKLQLLGQGIWPIARWETNRLYADDFFITLPRELSHEIRSVGFKAVPLTEGDHGS